MNRRSVIGFVLVVLLPAVGLAHRAPESLTTVSYSAATGTTEIVHRLHVHDAELGLAEILHDAQFRLGTLESQARLALYVEQQFHIRDTTTREPIALTLVGAKLDGDYVLVFQEMPAALPPKISVRNDVLREVFPKQVNKVNFMLPPALQSLIFQGDDEWKDLR